MTRTIETRSGGGSSPRLCRHGIARGPTLLAAGEMPEGYALDAGFGRGGEGEQGENGAEHPGRKIKRGDREQNGAAAQRFEDRRRLAALLLGEHGDPRHLARALGKLESIERGLGAGLGLHPAAVADEADKAVRLLDLDRLTR